MKIQKVSDGHITLKVFHRNGDVLAELHEPKGHQPFVRVPDTAWAKQYQVRTHDRFFRNKADAGKFIKETFK